MELNPPWVPQGIRLYMRREDVIHPHVSGNKWRKLDLNLEEAARQGAKTLVTFGGAFSNHIYATAAAAQEAGFASAGIIRGEPSSADNATLSFARSCGMELIFAGRTDYRDKATLAEKFKDRWERPCFLPEGGTNCLAIKGCAKIVDDSLLDMDVIVVPFGTGGTMAGLIASTPGRIRILGISALKGDFPKATVAQLLESCGERDHNNWEVDLHGHEGGYARVTEPLLDFIRDFRHSQDILLDPVYTGKMMFRLKDLMQQGIFEPGTRICAIHTGGLQGWAGMKERFGIDPPA